MGQRRALSGWAVATSVYLLAVFHRSTLGVAGIQAEHRFGLSSGQLSVFVLLQIGVYAGMQIPTGLLVDRYGPRRLLVTAAAIMGVAQLLFSIVPNYPSALLARALLGCGDALTFVSVLRYAAQHFTVRQYPLVIAATATLGSVGNIVATLPLTASLKSLGWAPTFQVAAVLSLISGVAVWLILPASLPLARNRHTAQEFLAALHQTGRRVRYAFQTPGTRLGFWVHFSTMVAPATCSLLWGQPYLIAQGFSAPGASTVLLGGVVVAVVSGPFIGMLVSRRPVLRVPFALGVAVFIVLGWVILLAVFNQVPRPLAAGFVDITMIGGPVSAIGFALARDYNGPAVVGVASGAVNVGGFLATIIAAVGVGYVLDLQSATNAAAFRIAFIVLVAVAGVGTIQAFHWWLRARAGILHRQEQGFDVPVPLVRRGFDLWHDPSVRSGVVGDEFGVPAA